MPKKTQNEIRKDLRRILGLPEDEPGVVNILTYRGTIYGVYERWDDAYDAGVKQFGEGAFSFLDASISLQRIHGPQGPAA